MRRDVSYPISTASSDYLSAQGYCRDDRLPTALLIHCSSSVSVFRLCRSYYSQLPYSLSWILALPRLQHSRPHSIHRNLTAPNRYAPNRARARRAAAARSSTQSIPQTPRTPVEIPVSPLGVSGYGYNTQGGFGEDEERGVDVIVLE